MRRITAGLGALVALVALVGGVPYALWHFIGWPLPHRVPSWSGILHDLGQRGIPDRTLVDALAVVVWLIWGVLLVALLAELPATMRGRRAGRVPVAGPFQPLVGRLVAAVLVAALAAAPRPAGERTSGALALSGIARRPVAVALVDVSVATAATPRRGGPAPAPASRPLSRPEPPGSPPPATRTYVVRRGDTLWGIAERELGNPLRWREIAALNEDRAEGAGRFTDPHWIYPGWTLLLPVAVAGSPSSEQHSVAPASEPAPPSPALPARPRAGPFPSADTPGAGSWAQHEPAPGEQGRASGGEAAPARLPVAPIGVGLLAVGLLGLLVGLRRVQQRHRRRGRRIALPTGSLAETERALVAGADRRAADDLDLAIRLLGRASRGRDTLPAVLGALVRPDAIEFLLEEAMPAPPPFTNAAPERWQLDREDPDVGAALHGAAGDVSVLPCLVTVGADEEGIVMLNLESAGSVALGGDAIVAAELATAMALELASASWAECLELYDLGVGTEASNPYRCSTVASLADALAPVAAHHKALAYELDAGGRTSAAAARLVAPIEGWSALAFVSGEAVPAAEAAALLSVEAPERHGLALVLPGEHSGARWRLVSHRDGTLELPVIGRRVRPQRVSRRHLAGIAALLGLAASRADVAADSPPYDEITLTPAEAEVPAAEFAVGEESSSAEPAPPAEDSDGAIGDGVAAASALFSPDELRPDADATPQQAIQQPVQQVQQPVQRRDESVPTRVPPAKVTVGVLGPLSFSGLVREPRRGKSAELIVWLALHPNGAAAERAAAALWPAGTYSEETFRNYRWDARRALGKGASGAPLLSDYTALRVGSEVTTDWAVFRLLSASSEPKERLAALALVRGRSFGEVDWPWAVAEGFVASIESEVTDLALELGEAALEAHDLPAALRAAEQGILAAPHDERLHCIVMKAHQSVGNPAAVRGAMGRLRSLLEDEVEPAESVHPETQRLYESLLRRPPPSRNTPEDPSGADGNGVSRRLH